MHAVKGKSASHVMMNQVLEAFLHLVQIPTALGLWQSRTKVQYATSPPWDSPTGFLRGKLSSTGFPGHKTKTGTSSSPAFPSRDKGRLQSSVPFAWGPKADCLAPPPITQAANRKNILTPYSPIPMPTRHVPDISHTGNVAGEAAERA